MTKNTKIGLGIIGTGAIILIAYYINKPILPLSGFVSNSITGCYVSHLQKDVYTLIISSTDGSTVTGKIAFKNFEKDSSSGSFTGTFDRDILLGNYSFESEGMHSNRQLIFKQVNGNFIEGFGNVKIVDDKEMFSDINAITFDPKMTFTKSENCTEF